MSDNTPLLTVAVLLEELKEVDNWYMLGAYLNVPVYQLNKIQSTHTQDGVERCKLAMLQYWLDTTMTASWKDIARALEQLNMLTLAARLKLKYLRTSPATTPEESSSLPQPGETDTSTLKTIEIHEEKKDRAEPLKKSTQPVVSRAEPVLQRQDKDYCIQHTRRDIVKLDGKAFIILNIISIVGLAIAYQYFCEAPMAELNTKLKNTEKKMQAAHELLAAKESELKEMRRRVKDLEELLSVHCPSSLVQVSGEGKEVAVLGQETTIQLNISSQDTLSLPFPIDQLSCQLTNPKSQRVPCNITHTQPGVCTLTFTPVLLSPHQLKITIRDTDIPGSPFTIRVLSSAMTRMVPENRGVVQGTIHGASSPYGVAVSTSGEVVVSEYYSNRISVFNREGKHIRSFGSEEPYGRKLHYPHGVAITSDNHVLIADEDNHRIQMFTMEGKFVKFVGQKGRGQLQFINPSGIAIDPTGRVFVADYFNHRIQVLNPDLSYSHMFGSEGSARGQFRYPRGVAINSNDVVYVTDSKNHRVQLFSAKGQYISSFGSEGSQHGQLHHPVGISVDSNNTVYVTDENHRVSVYTSSGQFIKCFGTWGSVEGELIKPKGVAVDDTTGALYVCDSDNNRVVVY